MSAMSYPMDSVLPWQSGVVEDQRFRKILGHALGVFLVVAIALPFFPVPEQAPPAPTDQEELLARLLLEPKPLPEPVKPKPKPIPPPVVKKEKPKPIVEPKKPVEVVKTKPVDLMKQARDKAAKSGVLAFADDLAQMREQVDVSKVKRSNLTRGADQAEQTQRKLLAAKAKASAAGISTASLSTDTGGVALSARETTLIDAPTGSAAAVDYAGASEAQDITGRSAESIRRIMDKNKGAVFAIYNRALRKDPSLAGKVLFAMVIEPSGAISDLSLVSSDLQDETLVKRILARIKLINFGAEPVEQTQVNYSFDFLPY